MAVTARSKPTITQLKVTLKGSRPPIWRRILVPSEITLPRLHEVLQAAMGWHNYHLHMFSAGGRSYGEPGPDFDLEDVANERRVPLSLIAPRLGARVLYEYDFGDSWEHELLVEKILPPDAGMRYPICVTGRRACPPEDVGGIWGYTEFLATLADPEHPEHAEMLEWIGGSFDADAFDLGEVNQRLGSLSRRGS